ncbi:MAG: glycoside hydrolase family 25 protein [Lachnospiraceae bacterium]|nr:glycoside hydrolase family 25 protein [Lachnospiraceae bacterium]
MDSKLKATVSVFAALMVLLVVGIVLVLNGAGKAGRNGDRAAGKDGSSVAEGMTDANEDSLTGMVDHDLAEKYNLSPVRDPYAFLEDESFFLQEETEDQTEAVNGLSLLVSSIQKDLRIFVVDGLGSVVSGQEFEAQIREKSAGGEIRSLKDVDKDGILYTDGLAAGDYEVVLAPIDGYSVPFDPMPVTILDKVSYTVLPDISFLIHTEDEEGIDATVEDTAVKEAENDADGTETNVRLQDGVSIFGIDVSKWNKTIDWNKVKNQGVDFAIIRCGYRGSKNGYLIEDSYFEENIKNATAAGVKVGVYFFTQAKTAAEGVEEASMVLSLTKGYDLSFPLYIDTEGAGGGRADGISVSERTEAVRAFCETVENAGLTAGVYASKSWLNHNLDMGQLSGYSTWLAQYSSKATYDGTYDMWQYTSAGRLDGIDTLVDYDLSYVDFTNAAGGQPKRLSEEKPEGEETAQEAAAGQEGQQAEVEGGQGAGEGQ